MSKVAKERWAEERQKLESYLIGVLGIYWLADWRIDLLLDALRQAELEALRDRYASGPIDGVMHARLAELEGWEP